MAFDATTFEIDPLTLTTPAERIAYLRDFLRRLPADRFDLRWLFSRDGEGARRESAPGEFVRDCGTAACVAGWACALFAPHDEEGDALSAAELLGLSATQGDDLFIPEGYERRRSPTANQAAAVLDHLLNTGEVDWTVAAPSGVAAQVER